MADEDLIAALLPSLVRLKSETTTKGITDTSNITGLSSGGASQDDLAAYLALKAMGETSPVLKAPLGTSGIGGQIARSIYPLMLARAAAPIYQSQQEAEAAKNALEIRKLTSQIDLTDARTKKALAEESAALGMNPDEVAAFIVEQRAALEAKGVDPAEAGISVPGKQKTKITVGAQRNPSLDAIGRIVENMDATRRAELEMRMRKEFGLRPDPTNPGMWVPAPRPQDVSKARDTNKELDETRDIAVFLRGVIRSNPTALTLEGALKRAGQDIRSQFDSAIQGGYVLAENENYSDIGLAQGETPIDLKRFDPSLGLARASLNALAINIARSQESGRLSDQDVERALSRITGGDTIVTKLTGIPGERVITQIEKFILPDIDRRKARNQKTIDEATMDLISDPAVRDKTPPADVDDATRKAVEEVFGPGASIKVKGAKELPTAKATGTPTPNPTATPSPTRTPTPTPSSTSRPYAGLDLAGLTKKEQFQVLDRILASAPKIVPANVDKQLAAIRQARLAGKLDAYEAAKQTADILLRNGLVTLVGG